MLATGEWSGLSRRRWQGRSSTGTHWGTSTSWYRWSGESPGVPWVPWVAFRCAGYGSARYELPGLFQKLPIHPWKRVPERLGLPWAQAGACGFEGLVGLGGLGAWAPLTTRIALPGRFPVVVYGTQQQKDLAPGGRKGGRVGLGSAVVNHPAGRMGQAGSGLRGGGSQRYPTRRGMHVRCAKGLEKNRLHGKNIFFDWVYAWGYYICGAGGKHGCGVEKVYRKQQ